MVNLRCDGWEGFGAIVMNDSDYLQWQVLNMRVVSWQVVSWFVSHSILKKRNTRSKVNQLLHFHIDKMIADMLTKPRKGLKFKTFRFSCPNEKLFFHDTLLINFTNIPNLVFNLEGPEYVYCVCPSVRPSVHPSACLSVRIQIELFWVRYTVRTCTYLHVRM